MQKDRIKIARKKVWEKILPFSQMVFHHPQNGWVKTIREILGMTSSQLGKNYLAITLNLIMFFLIRWFCEL